MAAPPLSTRAGPHSPRQGPQAANRSGARGEAPPLRSTSATSEEGERGEGSKSMGPRPAVCPPAQAALLRAAPGDEGWASRLFYSHNSLYNSGGTRGREQQQWSEPGGQHRGRSARGALLPAQKVLLGNCPLQGQANRLRCLSGREALGLRFSWLAEHALARPGRALDAAPNYVNVCAGSV